MGRTEVTLDSEGARRFTTEHAALPNAAAFRLPVAGSLTLCTIAHMCKTAHSEAARDAGNSRCSEWANRKLTR